VFPDAPAQKAVARLWDTIFAASRVDQPDPVAPWAAHNAALHAHTAQLNARRYDALHFQGPGTVLRVGLTDGHLWPGAAEPAKNGIVCNPNIPYYHVELGHHGRCSPRVFRRKAIWITAIAQPPRTPGCQ
jgi:aminopeptidase